MVRCLRIAPVPPEEQDIKLLVERLAAALIARRAVLCTAESCTGGWIAKCLTDQPGSSAWFEFGFVCYGNNAKQRMLGVDDQLLERYGAVSREVAEAMADRARTFSGADLAVAVTGIAGPDGGTADKPVGTVWLAWNGPGAEHASRREQFTGDRAAIRRQTVFAALDGILRQLEQS